MVDDDGIAHILGIHQVVAMFRCPDYFDGCVVHHKDRDKKNNYVYNLACMARSKHSSEHADRNRLKNYIKVHGPANKGKKMNDEFKKKCSEAAKLRGFNGNKYTDKYGNQR